MVTEENEPIETGVQNTHSTRNMANASPLADTGVHDVSKGKINPAYIPDKTIFVKKFR